MNDIITTAGTMEDKISNGMISTLADVESVCSQMQAAFHGSANITLDQIEAVCRKLYEKIDNGMVMTMRQVYSYMNQAGVPIPTAQDVALFHATGNPLGVFTAGNTVPTLPGGLGGNAIGPVSLPAGGNTTGNVLPAVNPIPAPIAPATQPNFIPPVPIQMVPPPVPIGVPGTTVPPLPGQPSPTGPPGSIVPAPDHSCPPHTHYDPVSDSCVLDDGWTSGSGTLDGGQCGPDGQWSWFAGTVTIDPNPKSGQPRSVLHTPCNPQITQGYSDDYHQEFEHPVGNGTIGTPWVDNSRAWFGSEVQEVCVDRCHWVPRPAMQPRFYIPPNAVLMADVTTGAVVYAFGNPGYPYVPIPLVTCELTNVPFNPTNPPANVPGGWVCEGPPAPIPDAFCKMPDPFTCEPAKPIVPPTMDGNVSDACKQINDALDKIKGQTPNISDVINVASAVADAGEGTATQILRLLMGSDSVLIPSIAQRFSKWLQRVLSDATKGFNCDRATLLPLIINQAVFKFIDEWTGAIPEQVLNNLEQLSNSACQSKLPSGAEADEAYLADTITRETWRCLHKAEGNYVDEFMPLLDAKRSRPNVNEEVLLYKRGYNDLDKCTKQLRKNGVTDSQDQINYINLSDEWPGMSDIVRFMVRDVWDTQAVTDSGLDTDFDLKWTADAKKFGFAAGISDDVAKLYWRAHWQLPSYTMMREFLYRLRPDKYADDMAFDRDKMEKVLKQDDWAPAHVKRMIETAYQVVTRTDAVRMYMIHQFDEDKLKGYLLDEGYNSDNADDLVSFYKTQRKLSDFQRAGYPSMRQLVNMYAKCEIDDATMRDGIFQLATSDDQIQHAIDASDLMRKVVERRNTIKTIQRQYRLGLIDDSTATMELNQNGIDPACIPGLVRRMKNNKQKQSKQLSAAQLCKLRKQGIITEYQQHESLMRIGWSDADATRIAVSCRQDFEASLSKHSTRKTKERIVKTTGGKTTTTDETIDAETLSGP